jgi:hypothetical protein
MNPTLYRSLYPSGMAALSAVVLVAVLAAIAVLAGYSAVRLYRARGAGQ